MRRRTLTVGSLITKKGQLPPTNSVRNQQALLQVEQNQSKFRLASIVNQTLLEAALNQGQHVDFKCRKGTCGRCTVKVIDGTSFLLPPNEKEQKKLGNSLTKGYRLACQAIMK